MVFRNLTLKTDYSQSEYPHKAQDIENINKVFEEYGLKVNDVKEGSQVIRYIINLPLDIKVNGKILRAKKAIERTLSVALKADNISYFQTEDTLVIERRGKFNIVPFGKLYTPEFHTRSSMTSVVLGQDLNGNPVFTDIAKAPHMLIAGTTGSGKSETLHAIVASLLMHNSYSAYSDESMPEALTYIDIIDMKGTEFNKYKDTYVSIISDENKAFSLLSVLCKTMENRYSMFAKNNCDDIDEYIENGHKLSRIVCIIDEFADLILKNPGVEDYVVRLAQKARACGIHLIIGTQSPRADVVTGLIKANIPFRIALNTANSMESRIIMDETGAEKLFGKGDMLIKKGGNKPIRVQGCYVADEDKINIAKLVRNLYPKNSEVQQPAKENTTSDPPKKVGFIQGIKNIWNTPPCKTASDYWNVLNRGD